MKRNCTNYLQKISHLSMKMREMVDVEMRISQIIIKIFKVEIKLNKFLNNEYEEEKEIGIKCMKFEAKQEYDKQKDALANTINMEFDEYDDFLEIFIKYPQTNGVSDIFNYIESRLNSDVKYISLNIVDELDEHPARNLEERKRKLENNIKELTINFDSVASDEERFTTFLKEILDKFTCLNITELILNGISDIQINELFSEKKYKAFSKLNFLRIENARSTKEKFKLEIEANVANMNSISLYNCKDLEQVLQERFRKANKSIKFFL